MDSILAQSIIAGLVAGLVPCMIIAGRALSVIIRAILIAITLTLSIGVCYLGISHDKQAFNNGFCPNCEIKLQAVGYDSKINRVCYECPNCFHRAWH